MREADERELSEPSLRARPRGRVPASIAVKKKYARRVQGLHAPCWARRTGSSRAGRLAPQSRARPLRRPRTASSLSQLSSPALDGQHARWKRAEQPADAAFSAASNALVSLSGQPQCARLGSDGVTHICDTICNWRVGEDLNERLQNERADEAVDWEGQRPTSRSVRARTRSAGSALLSAVRMRRASARKRRRCDGAGARPRLANTRQMALPSSRHSRQRRSSLVEWVRNADVGGGAVQ